MCFLSKSSHIIEKTHMITTSLSKTTVSKISSYPFYTKGTNDHTENYRLVGHHAVVVITSAQLHSTRPELRF